MSATARQSRLLDAGKFTIWQIDAAALGLCALLTCGAYFGAVRPMFNSRDERIQREASLQETRRQAAQMVSYTHGLRTQLNNTQAALTKIEIPLQSAGVINERLAELTTLAGDCGLEVQSMQPGAVASSPRYAQLPIQVSGAGVYQACQKFLHSLREKFPDTAVRAFDLSSSPTDPSATVSFNFQLIWYVQAPGADPKRDASVR